MTEFKLMNITLKVLGVYCAIRAVQRFHGLVVVSITTDYILWSHLSSLILFLICSFVLIRYSSLISRKLYPSDEAHPFQIEFSEFKWLDIAIRIIGITILAFLIPSRVSAIFQSIFTQTLDSAPDYMKNAARIDIWISGGQIVLYIFLGFLCVFKSKSITNFLRKKEVD